MLINPAEGVSNVAILKDLKKRVKSVEPGVTVQGIRETCSKDLLVELKYSKQDRGRLDSAFKEVIGVTLQGIRELCSKDLLVELKSSKQDRGRLDSTYKKVIGAHEFFRHLIPRIKVEIADIDLSTAAEEH